MLEMVIGLDHLDEVLLNGTDNKVLRHVVARGTIGDVKVWRSHHVAWIWPSNRAHLSASKPDYFDLIVLAEPKEAVTRLEAVRAFHRGLFEAPISITITHAINWTHRCNQGVESEKTEVFDQLHWISEKAYNYLEVDRYHFSALSIDELLSGIDHAIQVCDWSAFALNIGQLSIQEELLFDPYSGFFAPDTRKIKGCA